MAIDSTNPLYDLVLPDWIVMNDTYLGQRHIKGENEKYLPATSGMKEDGLNTNQPGRAAYDAYKARAVFPDFVRDAVAAMIGVMHHKPPVITLPESMEAMRETATLQGESLEMLLRRINQLQLINGRLGLLLDVEDGAPVGALPYIATYGAVSVINWDDGTRNDPVLQNLNLVVLDESEEVRQTDFTWEFKKRHRVLILGDVEANEAMDESAVYRVGEFEDSAAFSEDKLVTPSLGGRELNEIPFVFINTKDVVPQPDIPPLLGLADLSLTIYRGEADYRQSLFMQGQDTLVVTGGTADGYRTGANAVIELVMGATASFIGVESAGLEEQRKALENDRTMAGRKGGQLLDSVSREAESGEALKVRVSARTATLNQIALAGAFGLQTILRIAARWIGANPEEVTVTPNLDFVDDELLGRTLVEYMTAKSLGAPISNKTIHLLMQNKDITEMTFEEEMQVLENEASLAPDEDGTSTNVDGLEDDALVTSTEE